MTCCDSCGCVAPVQTVSERLSTEGRHISFEVFPPKGDLSAEEAKTMIAALVPYKPAFISVTYSAGGSGNSNSTVEVASVVQSHGTPAIAHLTCQGMTKADLELKISQYREAGIRNVLALSGDPRPDMVPGDYTLAKDIITPLAEAGFCVGAAAYPEGHMDCLDPQVEIERLKEKQDAGASFFVTQLAFDNSCFLKFRDLAAANGITVPICYGIMPFMSKSQVQRMIFMCGVSLPSPIIKILARYENDKDSLLKAGVEYAVEQSLDLARNGIQNLHLYTMNRPAVADVYTGRLKGI